MNAGSKEGVKVTSNMALFFCKAVHSYLKCPDISSLQRLSYHEEVCIW